MSAWTKEEDDFLRENWMTKSASEIGLLLNKTRNSIIGRANRIGLVKNISSTKKALKIHLGRVGRTEMKNDEVLRQKLIKKKAERLTRPKDRIYQRRISGMCEAKSPETLMDEPFIGIHLMDIKHGQCRFMKESETLMFCGHSAVEGSSYCSHHKPYLTTGREQLNGKEQRFFRKWR